jgi:hypothetical protein
MTIFHSLGPIRVLTNRCKILLAKLTSYGSQRIMPGAAKKQISLILIFDYLKIFHQSDKAFPHR